MSFEISGKNKSILLQFYNEHKKMGFLIDDSIMSSMKCDYRFPVALFGYQFRIKSFDSSLRKALKEAGNDNLAPLSVAVLKAEINSFPDFFRYNFLLFDKTKFSKTVFFFLTNIAKSFHVIHITGKNRFSREDDGYKDLKYTFVVLLDSKEVSFEVQFHTVESEKANFYSHKEYEIMRTLKPEDPNYLIHKNKRNSFYKKVASPKGLACFLKKHRRIGRTIVVKYEK